MESNNAQATEEPVEILPEPVKCLGQERKPSLCRGRCPKCNRYLYSAMYHWGNKGWIIVWECEGGDSDPPICDYHRVL